MVKNAGHLNRVIAKNVQPKNVGKKIFPIGLTDLHHFIFTLLVLKSYVRVTPRKNNLRINSTHKFYARIAAQTVYTRIHLQRIKVTHKFCA